MKVSKALSWSLSGVGVILTALQTNEILQWIEFGLTAISIILSIFFSVYAFVKKAKADGKLDNEEIEEAKKLIEESAKEFQEIASKLPNKKEGENK